MLRNLEEYLARHQWLQARKEVVRLLLLPPDDLTPQQAAEIHWAGGQAAFCLEDYYAALYFFEKAHRLGFLTRDWDFLGKTRAALGATYVLTGDLASANDVLRSFLLDLPKYDESRKWEGRVCYNLGLVARRQGRPDLAVTFYQRALDFFVERGYVRDAADCQQNMAWLYLVRGHIRKALPHLKCADSYVSELTPDYGVEMLCCWALYYRHKRKVGTAMEFVEEVLVGKRPGTEARHKSLAACVAADIAVILQQYSTARVMLSTALNEAVKAKDPWIMNMACKVRSKLAKATGHDEEAAQ